MRRTTPPALAALVLAALLAAPAAASDVLLADGRQMAIADLKAGAAPGTVSLARISEPALELPLGEILLVDFARPGGFRQTPTVILQGGGQIRGDVSFPGPRQVQVTAGWGIVTLPLEWCQVIRLAPEAPLPAANSAPGLLFKGDRIEGGATKVVDGKVYVDLAGRPLAVDLARVQAMILPRRAAPVPEKGIMVLADLGGGERLLGEWIGIKDELIQLRMGWGGALEVPVASLARLEIKNGRLVYLSDLSPSETRYTPYIDGTRPTRRDLAVNGQPLRLGARTYSRGLGVHSRTELTYVLGGDYGSFSALLGIDDSVGAAGSVIFRIYGDDRLLHETPMIRGGDKPVPVKLKMDGVLLLRLETDFGDEGDAADVADWIEARLLRK